MPKYEFEEGPDGWIRPIRKGYKMMCCDCGLVHKIDFRLIKDGKRGHKIEFRIDRDNRATGQARRWIRKRNG